MDKDMFDFDRENTEMPKNPRNYYAPGFILIVVIFIIVVGAYFFLKRPNDTGVVPSYSNNPKNSKEIISTPSSGLSGTATVFPTGY